MLPDGWLSSQVGTMKLEISDGNYSAKYPKQADFIESGVPFLRANNLKNGTVVDEDMRYISESQHKELKKGHLKNGDILITTRGDLGNLAIVPSNHVGSNINAQLVRVNGKDSIDNKYLYYSFVNAALSGKFDALSTGTALKQLPIGKLKKLVLVYPENKAEQKKIAQILSTWDNAISATERLLENSQQRKKALMQQLLTGKKRLPGFEGEWEEVKLGDVIKLGRGFAFKSSQYSESGYKIVRVTNIESDGNIDLTDCVYIPESTVQEYTKYELFEDDILLVMVGATVGKLGFVIKENLPALLNQNMWSIRTVNEDKICQLFLRQIATKIVERYLLTQQGSARGFFTQSTFEKVTFSIPSIKEQQFITNVLTTADQEIDAIQKRLDHLKLEKKALMQQLLTGKRRVQVDAAA